jgi:hypothetical protein
MSSLKAVQTTRGKAKKDFLGKKSLYIFFSAAERKGLFSSRIIPTLSMEKSFSVSPRKTYSGRNNKKTNRPRAFILRAHFAAKIM